MNEFEVGIIISFIGYGVICTALYYIFFQNLIKEANSFIAGFALASFALLMVGPVNYIFYTKSIYLKVSGIYLVGLLIFFSRNVSIKVLIKISKNTFTSN